jgi:hypothetical protein
MLEKQTPRPPWRRDVKFPLEATDPKERVQAYLDLYKNDDEFKVPLSWPSPSPLILIPPPGLRSTPHAHLPPPNLRHHVTHFTPIDSNIRAHRPAIPV